MQKKSALFFLIVFIFTQIIYSQISGYVTNLKQDAVPFVNIYIEGTYTGTTSNEDGYYDLQVEQNQSYTIVFKSLGYKTLKKEVTLHQKAIVVNASLEEENLNLQTVVVTAKDNPANHIIKATIKNRKQSLKKRERYESDFYSRGLIRIVDAPKKFLGQDMDDFLVGLDSTRSGILYLSETISKIQYQKPELKEHIMASKISGDNNGFSFNTASDVNFNLYNNTISLGNQIISPIADFAFNYYNYKLEGIFYDDYGNLINKIKVNPKRKNDSTFSGYIYIIEDQWAIYALELEVTGQQAQLPAADKIQIKQTFSYSEKDTLWALISQEIKFTYDFFGFKGNGHYTSVYSNYNFNPNFTKKTFTNQVLSFEDKANKKDTIFWGNKRPIPLTPEESTDYKEKDSIQLVRSSKTYLDSVDRVNNKFKIIDLLEGYTYQNSYKKTNFNISHPVSTIRYNTVQGYNANLGLNYRKNYDEYRRFLSLKGKLNYELSDEKLRGRIFAFYRFNNITRPQLSLSAGVTVQQFNVIEPIDPIINSLRTLFFEDNYMKIYERSFVEAYYNEELFNGFILFASASYEKRNPLFNTTDYTIFPQDKKRFTSNNPLDNAAYGIAAFESHNIIELNIRAQISFGQKYMSYPNSKFNLSKSKYPRLTINYNKGLKASKSNYNFAQIHTRISQELNIGNKGNFAYNFKTGKFFNGDDIAFMDYQHFNGNQTHLSLFGNYTNVFNNLPYYSLSTNKAYLEMHAEHNFKGYILGKIPLINMLNFNLIIGAHNLGTDGNSPYQEYTIGVDNIGWGKFRFLRLDYVRSYQSGYIGDAILFGIKI
ncbi:MAG: carboxypeptidase-like regulatory domain-containing protein [Flavobacteriaceae bacterium]|nr:carboxypeptidase-like regulatory domain-containing protein [Flavobacteriaceae bacterium]